MKATRGILGLVTAIALLGVVGCSSDDDDDAASGFRVTEKEFSVTPSGSNVGTGPLKVTVTNEGKETHELVVFRTDLGEKELPLNDAGDRVDEEGEGITHLDPEAEDVAPGTTKTITVDLPAGRYVFLCNLAGHYGQGMHTVVTAG